MREPVGPKSAGGSSTCPTTKVGVYDMLDVNIGTYSFEVSWLGGVCISTSITNFSQVKPPNSTSFYLVRTRGVFFCLVFLFLNPEWLDSISVCMETEVSPVTFVHLIERIMRRPCSWN